MTSGEAFYGLTFEMKLRYKLKITLIGIKLVLLDIKLQLSILEVYYKEEKK